VTGSVVSTQHRVGGLIGDFYTAGQSQTLIDQANIQSQVTTGGVYVGGFFGALVSVGTSSLSVTNSNFGASNRLDAEGSPLDIVSGSSYIGGLAGYFTNNDAANVSVNGLSVIGKISASNESYGGLVGHLASTGQSKFNVSNFTFGAAGTQEGQISGNVFGGGLVGLNYRFHSSQQSYNNININGKIEGDSYIGAGFGFASHHNDAITATIPNTQIPVTLPSVTVNNFTFGSPASVDANGNRLDQVLAYNYFGGVFGRLDTYDNSNTLISNSTVHGVIKGRNGGYGGERTGGLVGWSRNFGNSLLSIQDSTNLANITNYYYTGGAIGLIEMYDNARLKVSNVGVGSSTGDNLQLQGYHQTGGLIGRVDNYGNSQVNIDNSHVNAVISQSSSIAGGIVGFVGLHSNASLSITDSRFGSPTTTNQQSSITTPRDQILANEYIGGLIGDSQQYDASRIDITNTSTFGKYEAYYYVGGLFGRNYLTGTSTLNVTGSQFGSSGSDIDSVGGNYAIGGLSGLFTLYNTASGNFSSSTVYGAIDAHGGSHFGGLIGRIEAADSGTSVVLNNLAHLGSLVSPNIEVATLNKDGAGALTLTGSNQITQQVLISGGSVSADTSAAFGNAAVALSDANFALPTAADSNFSTAFQLSGTAGFEVASGLTATLTGVISGTGDFYKKGSGTLELASTLGNTYTGQTYANAGSLKVGDSNQLGTGSQVYLNGGTLELAGSNGAITLNKRLTAIDNGSVEVSNTAGAILSNGIEVASGKTLTIKADALEVTNQEASGAGTLQVRARTTNSDIVVGGTTSVANKLTLSDATFANLNGEDLNQLYVGSADAKSITVAGNLNFNTNIGFKATDFITTGTLATNVHTLTLKADNITLGGNVNATGSVVVAPNSNNYDIVVGGTGARESTRLVLSRPDFWTKLTGQNTDLKIGDANTGNITLADAYTLGSDTVFQGSGLNTTSTISAGSKNVSFIVYNLTFNGVVSGTGRLSIMQNSTDGNLVIGDINSVSPTLNSQSFSINNNTNVANNELQITQSVFDKLANGFTSLEFGRSDSKGNITLNSLVLKDDMVLLGGSNTTAFINGNVSNLGSGTSSGSLTVKVGADIVLNGASVITQNKSIVLNADIDGNGSGGIAMLNSQLLSNGGDIRLGGGTAGDGTGLAGSLTTTDHYLGFGTPGQSAIVIAGNSLIDSGAGAISIRGYAQNGGSSVDFNSLLSATDGSTSGLIGKAYQDPYDDDFSFFDSAQLKPSQLSRFINPFTSVNFGTPGANFDDSYSHLYSGYFYAPVSGVYNFATASDDGSQLFLGSANSALSSVRIGRPHANSNDLVVDNPGYHGVVEKYGSKTLEGGKFYPIVAAMFEGGGGDGLKITFQAPGMSGYTDNGAGYYFHNPSATGSGNATANRGVEITAIAGAVPTIRSTSGQISIEGQRAGIPTNYVLDIPMATLLAGGNSSASTSVTSAAGQHGVYISNISGSAVDVITISSVSGDINLKGQTSYSGSESGIRTQGALTITTGSGIVSVEGTSAGSEQNAIRFEGPTSLASSQGSVTLKTNGGFSADALSMSAAVQNTIVVNSGSVSLAGTLSGAGDLVKQGDGTLSLAVTNSMSGKTVVEAGTLSLSSSSGLAAGDLVLGTEDGSAVALSILGSGITTSNKNVILNQDALLSLGNGASLTLSGTVSGTGNFSKAGGGLLTLSGDNTVAGTVSLLGGQLDLGSANAIQNVSSIAFKGGALGFSAANTQDYSSIFSTDAGQTFRFNTNGQNVALANNFGSSSSLLIKEGSGRLTLNGASANQLSDGVQALGGEIAFARNELLGSGAITLNAGALVYTGNTAWVIDQTVSVLGNGRLTSQAAGGLTLNSNVTVKNAELTLQADKLSLAGSVSSSAGSFAVLPYSAGQAIEINATGSSATSLYLSTNDFAKLNNSNVRNLSIGDATLTGAITLNDATTFAANTSLTGASFTSTSTIASTNNSLSIRADSITFGDLVSGSNSLLISQKTNGVNIEIGGENVSSAGTLVLSDILLSNVSSGFSSIQYGQGNTGDIKTASDQLNKTNTTFQGRSFTNDFDLNTYAYDLTIKADAIELNAPVYGDSKLQLAPNAKTKMVVGATGIDANTLYVENASLNNVGSAFNRITLGSDTVNGLSIPNALTATHNLELRAATVSTGSTVDMGSYGLSVIADNITINTPITVSQTPGDLLLAPFTKGKDISVGAVANTTDMFVVDATTLAPFAGFNNKTIGNGDSGNIYINASKLTVGASGDANGLALGDNINLVTGKDILVEKAVTVSGDGFLNFAPSGSLIFKRNTDTNGTFANFAGRLTVTETGNADNLAEPTLAVNGNVYTRINDISQIGFGYFFLNNDIAVNNTYTGSIFGEFGGGIEGFGHVISGITINNGGDFGGIFRQAFNARFANFALTDYNLTGGNYLGALSGNGVSSCGR